jgi:ABC-type uncharacterized transport system permease subunit
MTGMLRERDYLLAWFVFWICSVIGGFIFGAIIGGMLGAVLGVAQADMQTIRIVAGIAGFLISIPVNFAFFRLFVDLLIVRRIEARMGEWSQTAGQPPQPHGDEGEAPGQ